MRWLAVVVVVVASGAGCTKPDPSAIVHPLESTLGAGVQGAYFAAVAMSSLGGNPAPCADVVTPAGSGSAIEVDVSLGASCPPMFGAGEGGTVVVTGTWTPQLATFLMDFTKVTEDGSATTVVQGIANMTVTPSTGTHLLVGYGEEDITVETGSDGGGGIEEVGWVVDVDTAGTADPSDDTITIDGGDQTLLAAGGEAPAVDISQVALAGAVFEPGCRRNPTRESRRCSARATTALAGCCSTSTATATAPPTSRRRSRRTSR